MSQQGLGSEFIVELSYELALEPKHEALQEKEFADDILKGKRILIVEDDLINQKVAENILSKWEVNIELAENGRVALEKVQKEDFDLILMDLHMPEMDGYEATKAIRSLNGNSEKDKTPIIALTADAFTDVRDKILEHQMDDFVSKPFVPDELKNKISRTLA